MIHWKTQLMRMHRISKFSICLFCIILFVNTSCSKKIETYSIGEWLKILVEKANIPESSNSNSYFLNINQDNPYFDYVQASVEWKVIDTNKPISLNSDITKEFVAYTLVNLMNEELNSRPMKDAAKSDYPEHCAKAVSLGIFELDNRGLFNPKEIVNKEIANEKLDIVIAHINDYQSKNIKEIKLNEQIVEIDIPIDFDDENKKIKVVDIGGFAINDIIHWNDGLDQFYRVERVIPIEDYYEIDLSDVDYLDIVQEAEVDGSFEVDFSKSLISSPFKEIKTNELNFENMSKKEFEIGSLNGSFQVDRESIQVKIKRNQHGGELVSEIKLYNVKPTIRWKTNHEGIQDAYFKIDFNTMESLKFHNTEYRNFYSDFKRFEGDTLFSKLASSFHKSTEMDGVMIPICDIQVPIPNLPLLTLGMKLQIHLYTSGKIELVLTNEHSAGIEIRNNKLRTFYDNNHDLDFIMKASANTTLGFTAALMAAKMSLMDVGIKGGVEGRLLTTVHLYEKSGDIVSNYLDAPLDAIVEVAANRDDVKVCGDIKMNWILQVVMNSRRTLANRFGLTKTFDVLNDRNASLIPSKRTHLENWQFIEKCTRTKRVKITHQPMVTANKITLERVNYLLKVDEIKQVKIISLPDGFDATMVTFEIDNDLICSVDRVGNVLGISKGSCTIKIKTIDNAYSTLCYVLVS